MKTTKTAKSEKRKSVADAGMKNLLEHIEEGKTTRRFRRNEIVFSQGDAAEAIYFIQTGKVRVTVVSAAGREAVLAMQGPRVFIGESSLVDQTQRTSTATAIEPSTLFRIESRAMLRAIHSQPELSEKFTASLLTRNLALEEDLYGQLVNHEEKRLARVLLKLARVGCKASMPAMKTPRVSHDTLAEMTGTTRSCVTHFMKKFSKLGLIEDNGEITVSAKLLTDMVLLD